MVQVIAEKGEPVERLLNRFKRSVKLTGIFLEVERRRYYEKPSEKKHEILSKRVKERKQRRQRRKYLGR